MLGVPDGWGGGSIAPAMYSVGDLRFDPRKSSFLIIFGVQVGVGQKSQNHHFFEFFFFWPPIYICGEVPGRKHMPVDASRWGKVPH